MKGKVSYDLAFNESIDYLLSKKEQIEAFETEKTY